MISFKEKNQLRRLSAEIKDKGSSIEEVSLSEQSRLSLKRIESSLNRLVLISDFIVFAIGSILDRTNEYRAVAKNPQRLKYKTWILLHLKR